LLRYRAVANVETVITNIEDRLNDEDLPTGEKVITGFTVGYNEQIVELTDLIVPQSLAEDFVKIYKPKQTALLTLQFINRAVQGEQVDDNEEEEVQSALGVLADTGPGVPTWTRYDTRP